MWLFSIILACGLKKNAVEEPVQIPSLSGMASISPSERVVTGSELTCSAKESSLTMDAESIDYVWTIGEEIISGDQRISIDAEETNSGDTLVCTVVITRPNGSTARASVSVAIENTPVVVSGIVIKPDDYVERDASLTCHASATDPDEELSADYVWQQNGKEIAQGETIALSKHSIQQNDKITCIASATDSGGVSASDEISVFVEQ